jgi:hypothetical protein
LRKILVYPDGTWQPIKSTGEQTKGVSTPTPSATATAIAQGQSNERWMYSQSEDKMGRGTTRFAHVQSLNEFSFGFPYSGNQRAQLMLRISPKQAGSPPDYSKVVILKVEQGQFLIRRDYHDRVTVRFDDGKPQGFSFKGRDDQNMTNIFLTDYAHFVNGLRHAKKVVIEAAFYQEGRRVFDFDVSGLNWSAFAPEGPELIPQAFYDHFGDD